MSEFVKFYQGMEKEYQSAKSGGLLEDCFYFTVDEINNKYRLYLNEHLVFSSNNKEDLANDVISSDIFKTIINKYLPLNGGTITGALTVKNTINANSLNVSGNISATNFKHEGNTITIPCALVVNGDTTINGLLTLDNMHLEKGNLENCELTKVTKIAFQDNAVLENLPTYKTQNEKYSFDFNQGKLVVNTIDAQTITINGSAVSTQNNATAKYQSIQIGSIILSDDGNGNLAITSVETN